MIQKCITIILSSTENNHQTDCITYSFSDNELLSYIVSGS